MSSLVIALLIGAAVLALGLPVMYTEYRLRQRDRENLRGRR